jgi:hypothetical protein
MQGVWDWGYGEAGGRGTHQLGAGAMCARRVGEVLLAM